MGVSVMKQVGRCVVVSGLTALLALSGVALLSAQELRVRRPVRIPDIPGYRTVKCDLHIHTVFSDGTVWPNVRSEEAWREGLDAIAITDHIEYQPHADDLPTNHDRAFEIAKPHGDRLGVTVIRGSEVTRDMPPGHLNAVFLSSSEPLDTVEWRDALEAAREQGAFIFWNHPGWTGQQPDGVARWYPEHGALVERDQLHGIEVVNTRSYYPEAHRWALEKDLAIIGTSDIHAPLNLDYAVHDGDHRPMTLVFAKDESPEAIREALFARRTAAYSGNRLIGREEFLRPLFEGSIEILQPRVTVVQGGQVWIQIRNDSDVRYELRGGGATEGLSGPEEIVLTANRTSLVAVAASDDAEPGPMKLELEYTVENLLLEPGAGLPYELILDVEVLPAEE
jgi:predicted metal-dependent phosphoesterase TrpH